MPYADIAIVIAVLISILVGFARGFVREAISVAVLLVAVWAAIRFAPMGGALVERWVTSQGLQLWAGRLLIFFGVLIVGGLVGWAVSYLVTKSGLSGTDRVLGMGFGFCRGAVLMGLLVIGGEYAGFSEDEWWQESRLMPYAARIADMIKVLAPMGVDLIMPESETEPEVNRPAAPDSVL